MAQEPVGGQSQRPGGGQPQRLAPITPSAPAANASKADVSYFLGFDFGSNLASRRLTEQEIDTKEFVVGLADALGSKKGRLNDDQIESIVMTLNQMIEKKMLELAQENLNRAKAYLEENKKKDGIQTTKSGLQYQVVTAGTGAQPTVADTVSVHYEGKLIDGTVFDSSIQRGQPAEFPVSGVVPGFAEALQRMKVGDKWIVTIPPELGYGERGGPGGRIGPNEALVFQLELLKIVK